MRVGQRRGVREVGEQPRRPVVAAAADDCDVRAHRAEPTSDRSQRARSVGRRLADQSRNATSTSISTAPPRGQRGDPDRGAGVAARVAEHLEQQRARAVDDCGLLHEARCGRHETEHGEHPFDAIERTEPGPQHRQRVQRAPARGLRALFDREIDAQHTGVHELAVVVAGQLPRRARPAAVHDHRVERIVRRIRTGQRPSPARCRRSSIVLTATSPRRPARWCRTSDDRLRTRRARALDRARPARSYTGRSWATVARRAVAGKMSSSRPRLHQQRAGRDQARRCRRARSRRAGRA